VDVETIIIGAVVGAVVGALVVYWIGKRMRSG
jgi:membrane protein DedA with SNARE-associated domain